MPRWAMMALLVLLVTVAPVTIALSHQPHDDLLMASPLTAMYELTRDRLWTGQSAAVDIRHWAAIWLTWGAAGLVWVMAGVASRVAVRPQHA